MSLASSSLRARIGLILGPLLFLSILLFPAPAGLDPKAQRMAAIATLMAAWWLTEAIPIAATALLPLALAPLLGVTSSAKIALSYGNHLVFLYLGGFILALGMERVNLHRRLALFTIDCVGASPQRLVLGFMAATAFLSMWVSNTATTLVMLPIAIAVIKQLAPAARINDSNPAGVHERVLQGFGSVLLLGLAFSASVGGIGTIIGTGTTVAFLGFLQERFPDKPPISFLDWALMGVPIAAVFIPVMWLYLCRFGSSLPLNQITFDSAPSVIRAERRKLGPMSQAEITVTVVGVITALGWVFRQPVDFGSVHIPGWTGLFSDPKGIHDTTISMLMAALLFALPEKWSRPPSEPRLPLIDWDTVQKGVPWGIILLLGGGFAMAAGIEDSGLASVIGSQLAILRGTPVWILVPAACLLAVCMTEITSNVATVLMLAPILAETALELQINPYLLLIPTTIMTSFAFMLPVATPPNAIVFSSGWITVPQMFRAGLVLDLLALLIVPAMVYLIGGAIFGFS